MGMRIMPALVPQLQHCLVIAAFGRPDRVAHARAPSFYRLRLPKIPRTSARPISLATLLEIERAALFIAASITVSRW